MQDCIHLLGDWHLYPMLTSKTDCSGLAAAGPL